MADAPRNTRKLPWQALVNGQHISFHATKDAAKAKADRTAREWWNTPSQSGRYPVATAKPTT